MQTPARNLTIDDLPVDILEKVFRPLSIRDRLGARLVCKAWAATPLQHAGALSAGRTEKLLRRMIRPPGKKPTALRFDRVLTLEVGGTTEKWLSFFGRALELPVLSQLEDLCIGFFTGMMAASDDTDDPVKYSEDSSIGARLPRLLNAALASGALANLRKLRLGCERAAEQYAADIRNGTRSNKALSGLNKLVLLGALELGPALWFKGRDGSGGQTTWLGYPNLEYVEIVCPTGSVTTGLRIGVPTPRLRLVVTVNLTELELDRRHVPVGCRVVTLNTECPIDGGEYAHPTFATNSRWYAKTAVSMRLPDGTLETSFASGDILVQDEQGVHRRRLPWIFEVGLDTPGTLTLSYFTLDTPVCAMVRTSRNAGRPVTLRRHFPTRHRWCREIDGQLDFQ